MKSVSEKLDDVFDVESDTPQEIVASSRNLRGVPAPVEVESNPDDRKTDSDTDYKLVRETLHNALIRGNDALEGSMELAKEQQHPRAYEVVSGMLRDITGIANDLINLQEKMNKISGDDSPQTVNQTMNVTLTTSELQKMLKNENG
jgi:hypothetical protein